MKSKRPKNTIIAAIAVGLVLLASFWYGGNAPELRGWNTSLPSVEEVVANPYEEENIDLPHKDILEETPELESIEPMEEVQAEKELEAEDKLEPKPELEVNPELKPDVKEATPSPKKDKYQTDPIPEEKPAPIEPQDTKISETAYTATLSVRADTILNNMDWLDPEKLELVPEDGVVFPATQVTFYEGESVFNVLQREMKKAKIHLEFTNTPIHNSAYIEGIQNLYEFDCGELSGWLYKVNGWFPSYGSSRYLLKEGDAIEWVYTCDLGIDVGRGTPGRQVQ